MIKHSPPQGPTHIEEGIGTVYKEDHEERFPVFFIELLQSFSHCHPYSSKSTDIE